MARNQVSIQVEIFKTLDSVVESVNQIEVLGNKILQRFTNAKKKVQEVIQAVAGVKQEADLHNTAVLVSSYQMEE